jgi:hypothetical protein
VLSSFFKLAMAVSNTSASASCVINIWGMHVCVHI